MRSMERYYMTKVAAITPQFPNDIRTFKEVSIKEVVDPSNIRKITESIMYLAGNPEIVEKMRRNGKK